MELQPKKERLSINGVQLSVTDTGKGDKCIVFVHGFPFNQSSWEPQLTALQNKFRVVTFDLRGFGQSEAGRQDYSIDLFASDLLQLIDTLQLVRPVVCGLSMGAYITMNAATRIPDKFGGLVLADTQCIADSEENRKKRFDTIDKIRSTGLEDFANGYVKNVLCKHTLENKKEIGDQLKAMITANQAGTTTATMKALADRRETCNRLKDIEVPTLIICGREDTVTPMSQAELLNNTISGSKLRLIDQAGHMSNLEQPDAFNKALIEFLEHDVD